MDDLGPILTYSAAWATFGIISGWLASRAPLRWFATDSALTRIRRFELRGRWYNRRFRIAQWKDRLPEAGALFGGESKRRLPALNRDTVVRLMQETRRAEWVHWVNVWFGPTFLLWNPWPIGVFMSLFGLIAHLPFIMVQRYNRARIQHILSRPTVERIPRLV